VGDSEFYCFPLLSSWGYFTHTWHQWPSCHMSWKLLSRDFGQEGSQTASGWPGIRDSFQGTPWAFEVSTQQRESLKPEHREETGDLEGWLPPQNNSQRKRDLEGLPLTEEGMDIYWVSLMCWVMVHANLTRCVSSGPHDKPGVFHGFACILLPSLIHINTCVGVKHRPRLDGVLHPPSRCISTLLF
jgi:hypothetical protein